MVRLTKQVSVLQGKRRNKRRTQQKKGKARPEIQISVDLPSVTQEGSIPPVISLVTAIRSSPSPSSLSPFSLPLLSSVTTFVQPSLCSDSIVITPTPENYCQDTQLTNISSTETTHPELLPGSCSAAATSPLTFTTWQPFPLPLPICSSPPSTLPLAICTSQPSTIPLPIWGSPPSTLPLAICTSQPSTLPLAICTSIKPTLNLANRTVPTVLHLQPRSNLIPPPLAPPSPATSISPPAPTIPLPPTRPSKPRTSLPPASSSVPESEPTSPRSTPSTPHKRRPPPKPRSTPPSRNPRKPGSTLPSTSIRRSEPSPPASPPISSSPRPDVDIFLRNLNPPDDILDRLYRDDVLPHFETLVKLAEPHTPLANLIKFLTYAEKSGSLSQLSDDNIGHWVRHYTHHTLPCDDAHCNRALIGDIEKKVAKPSKRKRRRFLM